MIDRISPTRRPQAPVAGYHHWHDLAFFHWRVPADTIQKLLPEGLTVDTWDGSAWVGLVPFYMARIRPWWAPAVPGVSWFCETNVRTYVHVAGQGPGVWFFSLDASNSLAVRAARWGWHLPYFRADMTLNRTGRRVEYTSRRRWPGPAGASTKIAIEVGDLLGAGEPSRTLPPGESVPGTFEHFLVERYILYAQVGPARFLQGRVHHTPYPFRSARILEFQQTLLPAAGIAVTSAPDHVAFSDGVHVEVFGLQSVPMSREVR